MYSQGADKQHFLSTCIYERKVGCTAHHDKTVHPSFPEIIDRMPFQQSPHVPSLTSLCHQEWHQSSDAVSVKGVSLISQRTLCYLLLCVISPWVAFTENNPFQGWRGYWEMNKFAVYVWSLFRLGPFLCAFLVVRIQWISTVERSLRENGQLWSSRGKMASLGILSFTRLSAEVWFLCPWYFWCKCSPVVMCLWFSRREGY